MLVWVVVVVGAVVSLAAIVVAVFMANTQGRLGLADPRRVDGDAAGWLRERAGESYCYLVTRGRVTGEPHEIEIWFAADGPRVYLLAGGHDEADWVRNLREEPRVVVRIGDEQRQGSARIVTDADEERRVRTMLAGEYQEWEPGAPLSEWAENALPVAIDLDRG